MTAPDSSPQSRTGSAPGAQRLAQSRLAILAYLQRSRHGAAATEAGAPAHPAPGAQDAGEHARAGAWHGVRDAARRYWEDHPARLAAGLAAPLVSHWGRRHPLAFLAMAAGLGAALVLARPWKLVSVTGVLVAALKSSNLASLAMSALAARRTHRHDRGPR